MARKLAQEFPGNEPGATMPEVQAVAEKPRKYLPFTTTDELPPAKTKQSERLVTLHTGEKHLVKEFEFIKAGEPRYSITPQGELLAWYKKRGGIGRKLVYQFKPRFKDNPESRARKAKQESFRRELRACGIPGA